MISKSWSEFALGELPKVPFLISPLLPIRGKLLIYAPAEHWKSMLLMNILYDAGAGIPILGRWPVAKPLRSLMIEQELGDLGVKTRCKKIHDFKAEFVAGENVFIIEKKRELRLDTEKGLGDILDELKAFAKADTPIDILALDPIRKFYIGSGDRDEDSSNSVTKVIQAMDFLIQATGVSIIFTHHQGHPYEVMGVPIDKKHPRGSSVWMDEPDGAIKLTRPPANGHEVLRVEVTKTRHAEKPKGHFDYIFDNEAMVFEGTGKKV